MTASSFSVLKANIKSDLAAGMKVVYSPAMHYPPKWNPLISRASSGRMTAHCIEETEELPWRTTRG
jgi:hypothetical protein